jgi:8-oxo-dGTP diphosphatase
MTRELQIKQAAVILPYRDGKVLMQLRDEKEGIDYPGQWGFFGGEIEPGETPIECARRELREEIGVESETLFPLGADQVAAPYEMVLHAFYVNLPIEPQRIRLQEGADCGLFSLDEIRTGMLPAPRLRNSFPVISNPYVSYIITKLHNRIGCDASAIPF